MEADIPPLARRAVEVVNGNGPVDVAVGAPGTVDVIAVVTAKALSEKRAHEILDGTKIEESATADHIQGGDRARRLPRPRRGLGEL